MSSEEKEELLDHIQKLTDENNNLLLLNDKLSKRADDVFREYSLKGKELEEKLQIWNDMELALNYTRERELNLKQQKDILESKMASQLEQLGELEKERDIYYGKAKKLEKEFEVIKDRSEKYENAYRESENKRNEEVETLVGEISLCTTKEKEAIQKCILYERENEDLREMRKDLELEISSNKKEFEAMVKVMEDLENKLNTLMRREESIENTLKENNKKVEDSLLERDRAVRRETTLLKTIERLESDMKQLKNDLENKHNNLLDNIRNKHSNLMKNKDTELNEVYEKLHLQENQLERLERENKQLKNESIKFHETSKTMMNKNYTKIEELEKKLVLVESEKENHKSEIKFKNEQFKEEKRVHDRTIRNLEVKLSNVTNDLETIRKEKSNLNDEVKRLSFRIQDYERERNIAVEECDNLRKMHTERLSEALSDYTQKISVLEKQIKEATERCKTSEGRASEIIKLQEKLSDKWKKEHFATVKYFESIVND